jgi:hypothetical protein
VRGDSFIIHYHEQKGSKHLREYGYYLIYTKELVRDFCSIIRVLLSKRQVVRPMRSLSR